MTETPVKPKKKRLTKKQRGFVKDYVLTENGAQSVMKNYDVKDNIVAKAMASENLAKPYILEAVNDAKRTVAEALTEELLLEVHLEGLRATKMDGKGGMMIGLSNGGVESVGHTEMQTPDYAVRHKYLDSAYKLKGSYAPDKQINVNVELEATQEIRDITETLNAIHRGTSKPSDGGTSSIMGEEVRDKE